MTATETMEWAADRGGATPFSFSFHDGDDARGRVANQQGDPTHGTRPRCTMNKDKRYIITNRTDGVLAHPDTMTLDDATTFVQAFSHRYAKQGYYLTARREHIRPEDVQLNIINEDEQGG